jgi:hypothetical protein
MSLRCVRRLTLACAEFSTGLSSANIPVTVMRVTNIAWNVCMHAPGPDTCIHTFHHIFGTGMRRGCPARDRVVAGEGSGGVAQCRSGEYSTAPPELHGHSLCRRPSHIVTHQALALGGDGNANRVLGQAWPQKTSSNPITKTSPLCGWIEGAVILVIQTTKVQLPVYPSNPN